MKTVQGDEAIMPAARDCEGEQRLRISSNHTQEETPTPDGEEPWPGRSDAQGRHEIKRDKKEHRKRKRDAEEAGLQHK